MTDRHPPRRAPAIHLRRPWDDIRERDVTPKDAYFGRRAWLERLGIASAGALALGGSGVTTAFAQPEEAIPLTARGVPADVRARFPGTRNPAFRRMDRPLTPRRVAASYNNYYEFTTDKRGVWEVAAQFESRPWTVEVTGHCRRPGTFDVDRLIRELPMEERCYRFRCVEAWSMAVPWNGFPLRALLDRVEPTSRARFVSFVSFDRPQQAVGQAQQTWYPWPYREGLRMDEARHDLTMLAVGIYGEPLPNQHGAPIRLVTPWKYGYKSAKGIVRIELVEDQPPTFWNQLAPSEYPFLSNVNPAVPHPRWSQATERVIPDGRRVPTLPYNGYGELVGGLYGEPPTRPTPRPARPAEPPTRQG